LRNAREARYKEKHLLPGGKVNGGVQGAVIKPQLGWKGEGRGVIVDSLSRKQGNSSLLPGGEGAVKGEGGGIFITLGGVAKGNTI